jgi:uncharacterized protein YbaR (Trm112 family)
MGKGLKCPYCGKPLKAIPVNQVENENFVCRHCETAWLIVEC